MPLVSGRVVKSLIVGIVLLLIYFGGWILHDQLLVRRPLKDTTDPRAAHSSASETALSSALLAL